MVALGSFTSTWLHLLYHLILNSIHYATEISPTMYYKVLSLFTLPQIYLLLLSAGSIHFARLIYYSILLSAGFIHFARLIYYSILLSAGSIHSATYLCNTALYKVLALFTLLIWRQQHPQHAGSIYSATDLYKCWFYSLCHRHVYYLQYTCTFSIHSVTDLCTMALCKVLALLTCRQQHNVKCWFYSLIHLSITVYC